MRTRSQVLADVVEIMRGLSGDWQYTGPLTEGTRLLADMGLKSLDFVILTTAIGAQYGRLPFHLFFAEVAQQPAATRDVTVNEVVDFVCRHLPDMSAGETATGTLSSEAKHA